MSTLKKEYLAVFETTPIDKDQYDFFRRRIYDIAGINLPLNAKNESLMQNRLSRLVRKYQLNNFTELANLMNQENSVLLEDFISTMTTNKTHFFREEAHFDFLKRTLPNHFQNHQDLRIWCAASSTGQEPYSLAMTLSESLTLNQKARSKILATDIDLDILKKAQTAIYRPNEIDGLPLSLQKKYCTQDINNKNYLINPEIRNLIDFARFNLVNGNYKFNKPFDYIFCRNVLIYFDPPTTYRVIDSLANCLRPGGYLIVGHSESGTAIPHQLKSVAQAVYQKVSR